MGYEIQVENWVRQSPEADCTSTATCTSPQLGTVQKCTAHAMTHVPNFNAAFIAKFVAPFVGEVNAQVGAGYTMWSQTTHQTCTTMDVTFQCTWDDQKCHSVWLSDVVVRYNGYIRRRCNYGRGGGDETVWSMDTSLTTPTNITRLGCAATCDMDTYPSPEPGFKTVSPDDYHSLIVY